MLSLRVPLVTSEAFLWGFEGSCRDDEAVWTHCTSFLRTCVTFVTCFAPFTFLLLYIHGQFELCNIRISVSTNIWGVHRTYFRLPVIQVVTTSIRTEHQPCTTFPQPPYPLEVNHTLVLVEKSVCVVLDDQGVPRLGAIEGADRSAK